VVPAGLDCGDVLFALYYVSWKASTAKEGSPDLLEETILSACDLDDLGPDIFRSSGGLCGCLWVVARGYKDEVVDLFNFVGHTPSALATDAVCSLWDVGNRHIRRECELVGIILYKEVVVWFESRRGAVSLTFYIAKEEQNTAREYHSVSGSGRGPFT